MHLLLLTAAVARAEDVSRAAGPPPLATILLLLAVVAAAYLLTHFVVERAQQRYLFVSGIEYVLLGVLLGPWVVPQIRPFAELTRLGPVFAFAAGWVGLLYGLELERQAMRHVGRPLRTALVDSLVTGGIVTAAAAWLLGSGILGIGDASFDSPEVWAVALLLGAAAAAGSTSAVELLGSRYRDLQSELLPLLRRSTRLGDVIAMVAFALVFCFFHDGGTPLGVEAPRTPLAALPLTEAGWAAVWAGITFGLGLVLGLLFSWFIGSDDNEDNVFLAMVGILLFASGAAFFLHVSALAVNLVLGMVLAQTRHGPQIRGQLERTAKPARLVLLLFAGAHWRPVPIVPALVIVLGFLAVRFGAKVVGGAIGAVGNQNRPDLFRGMVAQGDVAVAMALSFRLFYEGPMVDLAYTAVLVGVVVNELISPRLLRSLLIDAGELRQDLGQTSDRA